MTETIELLITQDDVSVTKHEFKYADNNGDVTQLGYVDMPALAYLHQGTNSHTYDFYARAYAGTIPGGEQVIKGIHIPDTTQNISAAAETGTWTVIANSDGKSAVGGSGASVKYSFTLSALSGYSAGDSVAIYIKIPSHADASTVTKIIVDEETV